MKDRKADDKKALDAIVDDTLYRIRCDRRSAPDDVAELLSRIEENLCDYRFTGTALQRLVQPDERTLGRFREHLGCDAGAYLHRRRHEAALAMLQETRAPIAAVAAALGYDDPDVFSKWFQRRSGLRPRQVRRPHDEGRGARLEIDVVVWRRALVGDVATEVAVRILGFLYHRYFARDTASGEDTATGEAS